MTRHLRGWLQCEICDAQEQAETVVGQSVYPVNLPERWAVAGFFYQRDLCPR